MIALLDKCLHYGTQIIFILKHKHKDLLFYFGKCHPLNEISFAFQTTDGYDRQMEHANEDA